MKQNEPILYQSTARNQLVKGYFNYKAGQIHYATAGNGPAILFIHQSSSSMEEYASLVPYLSEKFKVVLFDLPGHGMSEDPESEPGVEEFTMAAISLIDFLSIEKCSIVGHHGGALMAMNFAYRFPKRCQKVILSGTSGIKTEEEKAAFKANLSSKKKVALTKEGNSLLLAWQRYVAYMPDAEVNDILRPFLNSVMTRIRPYDAHHAVLKWNRQPALESLKMPVLLLQGLLDEFVSNQENLLQLLPNAKRKVISKGGAFLFFDMPEECATIIEEFVNQ